MKMFAPIELPSSAVASRVASMKLVFSAPAAVRIARFSRSVGSEKSALRVKSPGSGLDAFSGLEIRTLDGHEGRAEALQARIVLVAARLVDGALAAPFGFERLHRDAVRLHAAVAAAFADEFVDDHALVRIGELAALAAAPLLGRAGLVVDQHREARHVGERGLHRHQLVAMMDG